MARATDEELERRADRLAEQLRQGGFVITISGACSEAAAAAVLCISERTLRGWRRQDRAPEYFVTSRVWYPVLGLVRYLEELTGGGNRQEPAAAGKSRQIVTSTDEPDE